MPNDTKKTQNQAPQPTRRSAQRHRDGAPQNREHPPRREGDDRRREGYDPRREQKPKKPGFYNIDNPVHKYLPLILVGVGVFLGFLLYLPRSGIVGDWLKSFLFGCFSLIAYAIPPMLVIQGVMWRRDILRHRAVSGIVYGIALLIMANVVWFTFSPAADTLGNVHIGSYYENAQSFRCPGFFGALLGYAFAYLTAEVGAPLVTAFLLVMYVYHYMGITPKALLQKKKQKSAEQEKLPIREKKEKTSLLAAWRKRSEAAKARRAEKKAQRAEKKAEREEESDEREGYYPATEESFDDIRRRMEREEKRYQKEQKKRGVSPAQEPAKRDTHPAAPVRETVKDRRMTVVDFDVPDTVPVPAKNTHPEKEPEYVGIVDSTAKTGTLTADEVFSGFDPLSDGSLISTGSPVWRTVDSSLITDDRAPAAAQAEDPLDKSTVRLTEHGLVSDKGGVGSFKIEAKHMDIPSSRTPRPAAKVQATPAPAASVPTEGETDISDLLSDIRGTSMPAPDAMATPDAKADSTQEVTIHPYVPPTEQDSVSADGESIQIATSHVVDHNHEVKESKKAPKRTSPDYTKYKYPPISLLNRADAAHAEVSKAEISDMIERLAEEFRKFKFEIKVHDVTIGPRITRYSISLPAGVRISQIMNLTNDIALGLAVKSIRINPVPNTPYLGVEIPNRHPTSVPLSSLIDNESFRKSKTVTTIPLGASVTGQPVLADIAKMPHVLVAGATGMGKSVFLNSLLLSLLYRARPDEVKLILVDPKRVELSVYNGIPHLLIPPVVEPQKAAGALIWAVGEMERRYHLMESVGMRSIEGYNEVVRKDPSKGEVQPKIIIAIDELNDLMMQARDAVEPAVMSIAQKARAAGIHLILCTQRPSVDVITGVIKANIPSRIALHVSSGTDSRTILDFYGAEKLLDKGDMLTCIAGAEPIRVQSAFVSDEEVETVTSFLKKNTTGNVYDEIISAQIESETEKYKNAGKKAERRDDEEAPDGSIFEDSKFIEACHVAFDSGKVSTSLLQRNCSLGYGRAAKYIDIMQSMGIVSAPDGNKPREVLMSQDQFMEMVARESYSGE